MDMLIVKLAHTALFIVSSLIAIITTIMIMTGIHEDGADMDVTVLSKRIDYSDQGRVKHYVVVTDAGAFEIDAGGQSIFDPWYPAELYSSYELGRRYCLTIHASTTSGGYARIVGSHPVDVLS